MSDKSLFTRESPPADKKFTISQSELDNLTNNAFEQGLAAQTDQGWPDWLSFKNISFGWLFNINNISIFFTAISIMYLLRSGAINFSVAILFIFIVAKLISSTVTLAFFNDRISETASAAGMSVIVDFFTITFLLGLSGSSVKPGFFWPVILAVAFLDIAIEFYIRFKNH